MGDIIFYGDEYKAVMKAAFINMVLGKSLNTKTRHATRKWKQLLCSYERM